MFSKTRVAVLRGGPSSEYHVSLKTGATVLANLPESYFGLDVFIDREGAWHSKGRKESPSKILDKVDVVWNGLHGEYGEDGGVQHVLEMHGVPFTGSRRFPSALSQSKILAKRIAQHFGIKTPESLILRREEISSIEKIAGELYRTFPQPSVIKPASKGSSIGVSVVTTPEEVLLGLTAVFAISDTALIEECIQGKEAHCGVIEGYRGEEHYSLIPVEVVLPPESRFFDFNTKYGKEVLHKCPGGFSVEEKLELKKLAVDIHKLFGLRHYSRSEFMVHPKRGIFFLEADSLPDLHAEISPFLLSLESVGSSVPYFLDHVLTLALGRK